MYSYFVQDFSRVSSPLPAFLFLHTPDSFQVLPSDPSFSVPLFLSLTSGAAEGSRHSMAKIRDCKILVGSHRRCGRDASVMVVSRHKFRTISEKLLHILQVTWLIHLVSVADDGQSIWLSSLIWSAVEPPLSDTSLSSTTSENDDSSSMLT